MMRAISSFSSSEASIGSLLGVDSLFSSYVALNATGCTLGVEVVPYSKLMMCLESLIISSKLTNFPITSSGDISLFLKASNGPCEYYQLDSDKQQKGQGIVRPFISP
jgi:hypothetical protein